MLESSWFSSLRFQRLDCIHGQGWMHWTVTEHSFGVKVNESVLFLSQSHGGQRSMSPLLSALSISIPAVSCLLQDYVVLSPPLSHLLFHLVLALILPRSSSFHLSSCKLSFSFPVGLSSLHCLQFAFVSPSVSIFCPLSPLHPLCKLLLVKLCSSLFLLHLSPSSHLCTCLLPPSHCSIWLHLLIQLCLFPAYPVSSHPPQNTLTFFFFC